MAGTAKTFCLPFDYVLYEMSYANCILYGATLPTYSSDKKDSNSKGQQQEKIKADDPKNKERVSQLIASFE